MLEVKAGDVVEFFGERMLPEHGRVTQVQADTVGDSWVEVDQYDPDGYRTGILWFVGLGSIVKVVTDEGP